jgi:curved DNA-binding protein CbpA
MSSHNYTYYQVLGLEPAVSSLEIKRAYRRLVKSLHPDIGHKKQSASEQAKANERMAKLNEAYETLKDKSARAAYDSLIGVNGRGSPKVIRFPVENSEQIRAEYLNLTFHPVRQKISHILSRYKKELVHLSQDIYDEALVEQFEIYSNEIESVLRQASQNMSKHPAPSSLSAAELMMRHSIAQAADGLEELKRFCGNYDYNHLAMATNLFRESNDLSKQALHLTRSC